MELHHSLPVETVFGYPDSADLYIHLHTGRCLQGIVIGKPILVVYARGGECPIGTELEALNFQSRYLEFILKFIGFTDIESLVVEPTLMKGPEVARIMRDVAVKMAQEMARTF